MARCPLRDRATRYTRFVTANSDLAFALAEIGAGDLDGDVVHWHSGASSRLDAHEIAVARPGWARALAATTPEDDALHVVVGDLIPQPTRAVLDEAGWGWLDRRGHLKLHHNEVWIDTSIAAVGPAQSSSREPFSGDAGRAIAVTALLRHPEALAGVRALARDLGVAGSTVSRALRALEAAGFVTRDHRAVVPELFWALAQSWKPQWVGLQQQPAGLDISVVAVGSRAAAALGGPISVTADYPLELVIPDQATGRVLRRQFGDAPAATAPARYTVAPWAAVQHPAAKVDEIPVAATVIVALSLANDPARGAEIVEAWNCDERVW